ncbi:MAG: RNA pyrophosphohydrolase [Chlamydiia bacterium]|nr:RNA pyrophosphohydrolase [Chlamydiia bacterium]MCH9618800.1 RNA pyrophosphohydrolase [Chlamydiia bacterium]MCH9624607.1 RNA pyrophosphohydrolase [Chlamydiia bacterium]
MKERRKSIRIILLNDKQEILLLKAKAGTGWRDRESPFWFTPGGGIEKEESEIDAAYRELYEETGIEKNNVEMGPIIWFGDIEFDVDGKKIYQHQRFIIARTTKTEITFENFTQEEKECINTYRWFSLAEIQNAPDKIYPASMKKNLEPILEKKYPKTPIKVIL